MKLKIFALCILMPTLTYSMDEERLAYYSSYVHNVTQILSPIECWHFMQGVLRHPGIDCVNKPRYERCQEYYEWLNYLGNNGLRVSAELVKDITEYAANQYKMPMLKSLVDSDKCCIESREEVSSVSPFILGALWGIVAYKGITWAQQRYYYQQKQHHS